MRSRGLILIRTPSIPECCGVLFEIEGKRYRLTRKGGCRHSRQKVADGVSGYSSDPPAMEGTRRTRSPSLREQDSPPRKRMSSSLRYTLRNWRIWPCSSRTCRERAGKREISSLSASATVDALQSTFGAPSVKRRKAVGISIVTGISESPWLGNSFQ